LANSEAKVGQHWLTKVSPKLVGREAKTLHNSVTPTFGFQPRRYPIPLRKFVYSVVELLDYFRIITKHKTQKSTVLLLHKKRIKQCATQKNMLLNMFILIGVSTTICIYMNLIFL
jgi:hypothetical protein